MLSNYIGHPFLKISFDFGRPVRSFDSFLLTITFMFRVLQKYIIHFQRPMVVFNKFLIEYLVNIKPKAVL